MAHRLFDDRGLFGYLLAEGRPPRPDAVWPGWHWHRDGQILVARNGDREVRAHNFTALEAAIRKREGHGGDGGTEGSAPGVGDRPGV